MVSGVLLVTALVCLRSLGNEFVLDDQIYIVGNRFIAQWSFLTKALYRDEFWFIDPKVPVVQRILPAGLALLVLAELPAVRAASHGMARNHGDRFI